MSLPSGHRLGAYEIISLLGAGGMERYIAPRDLRLKRDVALKILPETFASDPDRLVRFEREAELLASLNHPNIAQIHGLEEALVEGVSHSRPRYGTGQRGARWTHESRGAPFHSMKRLRYRAPDRGGARRSA